MKCESPVGLATTAWSWYGSATEVSEQKAMMSKVKGKEMGGLSAACS